MVNNIIRNILGDGHKNEAECEDAPDDHDDWADDNDHSMR